MIRPEELVLPLGWQAYFNQIGQIFYWNTYTHSSQWEYPMVDASQQQAKVDDNVYSPQPPTVASVFHQQVEDQYQVEGEYNFEAEEDIVIRAKGRKGVAVYGLVTADECVAFIKKYRMKPKVKIVALATHTERSGDHNRTVTDLHWIWDISDFVEAEPSFKNCDWGPYFDSDRILKKVVVKKRLNAKESSGDPTWSEEGVTTFLYNIINWPSRATHKRIHFEYTHDHVSIKPNTKTRDCFTCMNRTSFIPCLWPTCCLCCFYCYRKQIDKEMPHPQLLYNPTVVQAELQFYLAKSLLAFNRTGKHVRLKIAPWNPFGVDEKWTL
jgi:hypothetical protein